MVTMTTVVMWPSVTAVPAKALICRNTWSGLAQWVNGQNCINDMFAGAGRDAVMHLSNGLCHLQQH